MFTAWPKLSQRWIKQSRQFRRATGASGSTPPRKHSLIRSRNCSRRRPRKIKGRAADADNFSRIFSAAAEEDLLVPVVVADLLVAAAVVVVRVLVAAEVLAGAIMRVEILRRLRRAWSLWPMNDQIP